MAQSAVTRDQIGTPPLMQPRGPGVVLDQFTQPVMRPRAASPTPQYRMRGIVSGNHVYWTSLSKDSTGSLQYYSGTGTPPTDVVVVDEIKIS